MAQITVQLTRDAARELHETGPGTPASSELSEVVTGFGGTLTPLHPGVRDPDLMRHFQVDVPDSSPAEQVIERLRQLGSVDGAYIKPADELP